MAPFALSESRLGLSDSSQPNRVHLDEQLAVPYRIWLHNCAQLETRSRGSKVDLGRGNLNRDRKCATQSERWWRGKVCWSGLEVSVCSHNVEHRVASSEACPTHFRL